MFNFIFFISSIPVLGPTLPPTQYVPGAVSPEIKWPGNETDLSPPSSAEVKNDGVIHPLPRRLHGVMLKQLSPGTTLLCL
jgi:hypothetical protein